MSVFLDAIKLHYRPQHYSRILDDGPSRVPEQVEKGLLRWIAGSRAIVKAETDS